MRNPVMAGERVYLRPLETTDALDIARADAAETDTFMWRSRIPSSPLEHDHWISEMYRQRPPADIWFAVCTRSTDRFLGMVGILDIDWVHGTGETASWIGPAEVRGREYGTEAKHLLLEYCFDRLLLHVLLSVVAEPNTRSAAALGKQGYRAAGRRRWADVKGGRYIDNLVFDVTRDDWLAARDAWRARRSAAAHR
jgi:RimJ/RimL family protein N-acetyltransferase